MVPLGNLPYLEYQDDSGQTKRIYANVQVNEQIDLSSEVAEHPVESGVNIVDHIRANPDEVSVELFFSDAIVRTDILGERPSIDATEIRAPEATFDLRTLTSTSGLLTSAIGALTKKETKVIAYSYAEPDKARHVEVYEVIQELREKGKLITVKTTTALFEEMAIVTATIVRNAQTGNGANISLSLKKIKFVQSDITLALPLPKDARSQKKKSAGNEVPFGPPAPKVTALKQVSNAAGGTTPGSGI